MEITKTFTLPEIGAILIKEAGLHTGWFEVSISIGMGVGPIPLGSGGATIPGAMFGIHGLGLTPGTPNAPNTLDASKINPAPRAKQSPHKAAPAPAKPAKSKAKKVS